MTTRYLVGVGGIPNYGDELLNRTWVDYLEERFPEDAVVLSTGKPSNVAALQYKRHHDLTMTSVLIDLATRAFRRSEKMDDREAWIASKIRGLGTPDWDIAISRLRDEARSIHFMGGGYLNSDWPTRYLMLAVASAVKKRSGSFLFGTGLGLTPITDTYRPWVRSKLREFDYVESRDTRGSELLDVPCGLDDVWLAFRPGATTIKRAAGAPRVVVNLQTDYAAEQTDALLEAAVAAIKRLPFYEDDMEVGVAEGFPQKDGWVRRRLGEKLPNPITFYSFQSIWEDGIPAGPTTTWITTRFHFHLVASALGSPGLALTAGSDFYGVKHRSLLDLPSGWGLVDVSRDYRDDDLTPGINPDMRSLVERLAQKKLAVADSLYPSATKVRPDQGDTFVAVVAHKSSWVPDIDGYFPVVVGEGRREVVLDTTQPVYQDDTLENIANKNANFCELTAQYWVWRNVEARYKGMVHYRRFLKAPGTGRVIGREEIANALSDVDLLIPYRWEVAGEGIATIPKTVMNQYGRAHAAGDLLETFAIVEELFPDYRNAFLKVMRDSKFFLANMYIGRQEVFDDYSEWLFAILDKFAASCDLREYGTAYQSRVYGFLSERLFTVWLEKNTTVRYRRLGMLRPDKVVESTP
ncbi:hypothetical protein GCM10023221_09110 [Luteimicrobium xylanilyticum]|uniref:DUF4422 domain-containing protein n=1 Tax=Luteimicrobium xylanilyticum TaxID=1133546 RepID=UPI0004B61D8A